MPNPRRTKSSSARALIWIGGATVALVAAALVSANLNEQKSRTVSSPAPTAQKSATRESAPDADGTNNASPAVFLGWLTNQTDPVEVLSAGVQLLEQGNIGPSIACFHRTLELKPEDEEACFNLGVAFTRIGLIKEAEQAYRRALTNFPEYVEAYNNLGNLLTRQRRYSEATELFQAALQHNPDNASTYNNLGRVLAEQGNTLEALKRFTEAAQLDTNYVDARFNIGAAHLTVGQTNEAVAAFRDALRLHPSFQPALQALARLQVQP